MNANYYTGYIYIIKAGRYYKIGKASDMVSRWKDYTRTESPYRPKLLYSRQVWNYSQVEKQIHRWYTAKRRKGEWFALTGRDVWRIRKYLLSLSYKEVQFDPIWATVSTLTTALTDASPTR